MRVRNQIQLITYPDSLGKNLQELHYVMLRYFKQALGGVHILPFYPYSADRGFCPLTYDTVDTRFGTWEDVEKIGEDFDLLVDFLPNHLSRQSEFFQDYLKKGAQSQFYDLFLQIKKLYPEGSIPESELQKMYLRKPSAPEFLIEFPDGTKEKIWQTFESDQQIDLDVHSPVYRDLFGNFLIFIMRRKVKMIRLDALAYVTKKPGTSCFMVEPDLWEFLDWIKEFAQAFDVELLPEMHTHYLQQNKFIEHGTWAYDFVLPLMTLHALHGHTSKNLKHWLTIRPDKLVTTLDTHDGIPVIDVEDLMTREEVDFTVKILDEHGANHNYNHLGNGDDELYQMNITYFAATGRNDDAYLAARAIQFFAPGIPQVYYVGLLVGDNDQDAVSAYTGEKIGAWGRDVNRHNFTLKEIAECVKKPAVARLQKLMEFRNTHPAFSGQFTVEESDDTTLNLSWKGKHTECSLHVDLLTYRTVIRYNSELAQNTYQEYRV